MTNKALRGRVRFCPASTKKAESATPTIASRRDPNFVDMSDLESDSIGRDFFEFEEELSKMKPSNSTTGAISDKVVASKGKK